MRRALRHLPAVLALTALNSSRVLGLTPSSSIFALSV